MARHPSPRELTGVVEGHAGTDAACHVADCPACRARVEELQAVLACLSEVDVPEPPPLYWQAFRQRVARRLEEDAPVRRRSAWLWLPALAAAAVLVLALGLPRGWQRPGVPLPAPGASHVPAWSPLPADDDDAGWLVLQALADGGGLGSAAECRGLAECLSDLPEETARGLAQALRAELPGGES